VVHRFVDGQEDCRFERARREGCLLRSWVSPRLMNYTCVGDTPNAAKRLQENAIADQILICPATYEAVSDAVVVKPMGPMMLKGRVTPVQAYEVLGLK
jgi:class 3 adenylate cyclase